MPETSTAPVTSSTNQSQFIPLSDFMPSYVMIVVLSFIVICILCTFLFELSYPKLWSSMISAPLLGKR